MVEMNYRKFAKVTLELSIEEHLEALDAIVELRHWIERGREFAKVEGRIVIKGYKGVIE
jgi:hypothetical protein